MGSIASNSLVPAAVRLLRIGLSVLLGCAVAIGGAPPVEAGAEPVRGEEWQLAALDARDAWKVSTGKGVTVAVIDSGVDASHPDLAGQVLAGIDFVEPAKKDGGAVDPVGHGTTVAALIAGSNRDRSGVEGIAPGAKILPIRVLDKANKYDDPAIVAQAVRWAVDHGAGVVNLSLGGAVRSAAIADSLRYAALHDVVVVACTGNIATDPSTRRVWYPAREPGVIAVAGLGSSSDAEALWSGSITGPETVLTAPAVNLTGAKPGGGYWQVQGTSFAAPLVAGAAALIRAKYPHMSAANVINRLIGTAKDLGPAGRDDQFGYGEVDPAAALRTTKVADVEANPLDAPAEAESDGDTTTKPGGAAPLPEAPAVEDAAADQQPTTSAAIAGLTAMLLVLIGGAAGVLLHHRRS